MSVDTILRDMVRAEVERLMAPLAASLANLEAQASVVSRLAAVFNLPVPGAKRGPGRPPKALVAGSTAKRGPGRPKKSGAPSDGRKPCAVEDCQRPTRSKGYCAAHYQKFRMLESTGRLPSDWVADAEPNTVKNIVLPRGRAGAKLLAESKKK